MFYVMSILPNDDDVQATRTVYTDCIDPFNK